MQRRHRSRNVALRGAVRLKALGKRLAQIYRERVFTIGRLAMQRTRTTPLLARPQRFQETSGGNTCSSVICWRTIGEVHSWPCRQRSGRCSCEEWYFFAPDWNRVGPGCVRLFLRWLPADDPVASHLPFSPLFCSSYLQCPSVTLSGRPPSCHPDHPTLIRACSTADSKAGDDFSHLAGSSPSIAAAVDGPPVAVSMAPLHTGHTLTFKESGRKPLRLCSQRPVPEVHSWLAEHRRLKNSSKRFICSVWPYPDLCPTPQTPAGRS